jgi:hypothetical protein
LAGVRAGFFLCPKAHPASGNFLLNPSEVFKLVHGMQLLLKLCALGKW